MSHFVLELFLDANTERAVQSLWGVVDALPDWTPKAQSHAPHISVCSCPSLVVDDFRKSLLALAADTAPLPIEFASVASFASAAGVVFLAPVVTARLLALHAQLVATMRECGAAVPDSYQPGRWVPHCTVAQELPREVVCSAIDVALQHWSPVAGRIEQICLVEVMRPQSRLVAECSLTGYIG